MESTFVPTMCSPPLLGASARGPSSAGVHVENSFPDLAASWLRHATKLGIQRLTNNRLPISSFTVFIVGDFLRSNLPVRGRTGHVGVGGESAAAKSAAVVDSPAGGFSSATAARGTRRSGVTSYVARWDTAILSLPFNRDLSHRRCSHSPPPVPPASGRGCHGRRTTAQRLRSLAGPLLGPAHYTSSTAHL